MNNDNADHIEDEDGKVEDKEATTTTTSTTTVIKVQNIDRPRHILPLIVLAQFAGTSLWFAGNAVLSDLVDEWQEAGVANISDNARSYLTSVVQLGFIFGTLLSAFLNIVDRFRPTQIFFISAVVGAILNAIIPLWRSLVGLILFRFGTGIAMAGIYPVGMKVAADWFEAGLGRALGFLVGALAVGSATPFLLNQIPQPWEYLLWETSGLAILGGLAVGWFVPEGPHRKPGMKLDPSIVWTLFEETKFRGASSGYFGHMWELYAFWTWCPVVWKAYLDNKNVEWDESAITFAVLAIGGLGCIVGGFLSATYGSAAVAFVSLSVSGMFCLLSPALYLAPPPVMLIAYLLWGAAVVADSPQFSSLVATTAPASNKGTALTIVNSIGFALTIGSIQLLGGIPILEQYLFLLLAPGPIFGLWAMRHCDVFSFGDSSSSRRNTDRKNDGSRLPSGDNV